MVWQEQELDALVTTLRASAPDAPTLCEGWEARHLASHLYLRRHNPLRLPRLNELADLAANRQHYLRVVDAFAAPVRRTNPLIVVDRLLGEKANLLEYVIHHEDLRRGTGEDITSRELPTEMSQAILKDAVLFAKLRIRTPGFGLVFEVPGVEERVVRREQPSATVSGSAADLALVASGRRRAAQVEVHGDGHAISAFNAATA